MSFLLEHAGCVCQRCRSTKDNHPLCLTHDRNMRNNGTKFRLLATQKPRIVRRLFETYGFETIILSDTDTVWLRHPQGPPVLICLYVYVCLFVCA